MADWVAFQCGLREGLKNLSKTSGLAGLLNGNQRFKITFQWNRRFRHGMLDKGIDFPMQEFECIELDSVESVSVVKFKDQKLMDPMRIEQLGKELLSLVDDEKSDRVLINFENVSFFRVAQLIN